MKTEGLRINCKDCSASTLLKSAGYYDDDSQRCLCSCCEQNGGVWHRCPQAHPAMAPKWLPLLLAGIDIVCPECKRAYDLGVKVEPTYPEVGQALKAAGVSLGILILIGIVGDALQGKRRRR